MPYLRIGTAMGKMGRDELRFRLRGIASLLWDTQRQAAVQGGSTRLNNTDVERRLDAAQNALGELVNDYFEQRGVYD